MQVLFLDEVHPILQDKLEKAGVQCRHDYSSKGAELHQVLGDYDGVVIRSRVPVDRAFFEAAHQLKFIARSGAGLENIDLVLAKEFGVEVFHSPEGNRRAVAEHAIMLMLMLLNHAKRGDAEVRDGQWNREKNRGKELANCTVGVVGYGYMGKELVEVLKGFGAALLVHDKYLSGFGDDRIREVSLDELRAESDIISLHLPENEETHHYVNAAFIEQVSKPFYLINTARGKNVSLEAVVNGLASGKLLGAGLDVLEVEKRSFEGIASNPWLQTLLDDERVVFSPHVAGWTQESYVKLSDVLFDKIEAAFLKQ